MSDSEQSNETTAAQDKEVKREIFVDLLILSLISAVIGLGLYFVMKPFKKESPSDALYSTVLKGDRIGSSRSGLVDSIVAATKASSTKATQLDEDEKKTLENYEKEFNQGVKKYKELAADGETAVSFVNAADDNGITPLMRVCYSNLLRSDRSLSRDKTRLRFVEQLLTQPDIDIQLKDKHGFTALHWAAWSGFPIIAEKLIDSGLQINQTENNGYTPLALAALRGNNEVVAMLLKRGADKDAKTKDGETALDLVKRNSDAYGKRAGAVYSLIYDKNHHGAYGETRQLLDPSYQDSEMSEKEKMAKKLEQSAKERDKKLEAKAQELLDLARELDKQAKAEQEAAEKALKADTAQ